MDNRLYGLHFLDFDLNGWLGRVKKYVSSISIIQLFCLSVFSLVYLKINTSMLCLLIFVLRWLRAKRLLTT